MSRATGVRLAAVSVFAAVSGVWLGVQGQPHVTSDVTPAIAISMGGATVSMMVTSDTWNEAIFYAGDQTQRRQFCMGGATGGQSAPARLPAGAQPDVLWRVAARVSSFDEATGQIRVRWRREVNGEGYEPSNGREGEFTFPASEDARMTLDLVRQTPAAVDGCESQSIELRYAPYGPEELRDAALSYDIWLLQQRPSGEMQTRHMHSTGTQGTAVAFAFPTISIDAPASKNAVDPAALNVTVAGRVRGRVRRDGQIDVAVDAGRTVIPRGSRLGQGNSGRTRLTLSPGETVELTPPPLKGDNDGAFAEVLAKAPTAIRVRVRRLW